jgi:hypothetical protein
MKPANGTSHAFPFLNAGRIGALGRREEHLTCQKTIRLKPMSD